jgi:hypothetical protein
MDLYDPDRAKELSYVSEVPHLGSVSDCLELGYGAYPADSGSTRGKAW